MPPTARSTLEDLIREALGFAMDLDQLDVAGHLAHALHAHVSAVEHRITPAPVNAVQLRPTADDGCRCPAVMTTHGPRRVGYAPQCPVHTPGAPGLGEAPTERLTDPAATVVNGIEAWGDLP